MRPGKRVIYVAFDTYADAFASETDFGRLFEQWIILQCIGYVRVHYLPWRCSAYRTEAGAEVDFIIDIGSKLIAIECKWGSHLSEKLCKGLRSFKQVAHKPVDCYIVNRARLRQLFSQGETNLSYADFFNNALPAAAKSM